MQDLQAHRTEIAVPVDSGVAITPEGAAHHEVLQESEAIQVVVGLGENVGAGMSLCLLTTGGGFVEEVNRKGADRLRQDSDAGPDCRDGQRAFRGDDLLRGGIGHGVGEKHLIHSVLEFL